MTHTPDQAPPAARFSASDAPFFVFAHWRARPGRYLAVFAIYLVLATLFAAPAAFAMWRDLGQGIYPFGQAAALRASGALLSLYSLLQFPLNAVILAALLRMMLPRDPRPSFAHDAVLVLVVQIVITMAAIIIVVLAVLIGMLAAALAAFLVFAAAGGAAAGPPPPALLLSVNLLPLLLIAAVAFPAIYLLLRFSLAAPLTVAEGRLRVFQSWPATRGFAAALFGAHLLRFVMIFVFWVVVAAALGVAALLTLGPDLGAAFSAFQTRSAPSPRVLGIIAVFAGLYWLAMATLEFLSLAMGAGVGASFLTSRRRVEPAPDSG